MRPAAHRVAGAGRRAHHAVRRAVPAAARRGRHLPQPREADGKARRRQALPAGEAGVPAAASRPGLPGGGESERGGRRERGRGRAAGVEQRAPHHPRRQQQQSAVCGRLKTALVRCSQHQTEGAAAVCCSDESRLAAMILRGYYFVDGSKRVACSIVAVLVMFANCAHVIACSLDWHHPAEWSSIIIGDLPVLNGVLNDSYDR